MNDLECSHSLSAIRQRRRSNGVKHFVYQCLQCGEELRAVGKKDPAILSLADIEAFDEALRESWYQRRQEYWREQSEQRRNTFEQERERQFAEQKTEADRANREWWERYTAYLKTPQWRSKRTAVLARANGMCEGCLTRRATQVHHLTYAHVGDEFLFELVAICDECHSRIHKDRKEAIA